jgi:signal transduction histidine kinase
MISTTNSEMLQELQRQLAKMEQALERAERRATAGRFASEIIHEINNPLEAVANLAFLMKSQQLPEPANRYLEVMEEQIERINQITRRTLGFNRIVDHPLKADLVELIQMAIRTYFRDITLKSIKLELDLPPLAECEVYPGELTQVFSNLISNAVDASEPGGRLRIRIRSRDPGFHITVCDSGCGIPTDIRNAVFEAFTTGKESGNGLGLWITRRIVEKHGGRIQLRTSTRPERHGTAFRILLKAAQTSSSTVH